MTCYGIAHERFLMSATIAWREIQGDSFVKIYSSIYSRIPTKELRVINKYHTSSLSMSKRSSSDKRYSRGIIWSFGGSMTRGTKDISFKLLPSKDLQYDFTRILL